MNKATQALRSALEAFLVDDARERLARLRADPDAEAPAVVLHRHRWLSSEAAREALEEAAQALSPADHERLSAHLAAFTMRRAWLAVISRAPERLILDGQPVGAPVVWQRLCTMPKRAERGQLAGLLVEDARGRWQAQVEALGQAREAAQRWQVPSARAPSELMEHAQSLLRATEDPTRELIEYFVRDVARGVEPAWHDLAYVLRASSLDGLVKPASRSDRVAAPWRALGMARELESRVRLEPVQRTSAVLSTCLAQAAPGLQRVLIPPAELGLVSELAVTHAVAMAIGLALVSTTLPVEQRWPMQPRMPRALGALLTLTLADRSYHKRALARDPREAEWLARTALLALLLHLRRLATLTLLEGRNADVSERDERARAAWCVDTPFAIIAGMQDPTQSNALSFEAWLVGSAASMTLRERFDDDWYRNPRVGEVLRGAAARGDTLGPGGWLQELGGKLEHGATRLIELAQG